ncbi:putative ATP-dependent RNA helicase [Zostera marina]|uniref:RNA helicase n=1 Tax=Zostera marina TaxID=29655 RepID=A0A0K9PYS0_ZOSMR|nr:putative ATP-dependent RNA helicase [Zostera marina]
MMNPNRFYMSQHQQPSSSMYSTSQQRQYFGENHRPQPPSSRPNGPLFAVALEFQDKKVPTLRDLEKLIVTCPVKPEQMIVKPGETKGLILYNEWHTTLDAFIYFWRRRLFGTSSSMYSRPVPQILFNCTIPSPPSNKEEKESRMRNLFKEYAQRILCGSSVKNIEKRINELFNKIEETAKSLKNPNSIMFFFELESKHKALVLEKKLLTDLLTEFKTEIGILVQIFERKSFLGHSSLRFFHLENSLNWMKLQMMMERECRRLENGLPMYVSRKKILSTLYSNQVTILIGETGSGKSTQLVQYIADSQLAGDGCVVCTQPRKIASISLAQRVKEETYGCYEENSVSSYSTYSSSQKFNSKIIFMTDYCLLQHSVDDEIFNTISCIVVDEAHERSLNTDLLLALIRRKILQRKDLRLIIMSATADAEKISEYFFGCQTIHVTGRNFPVEIKYIPDISSEVPWINHTKHIPMNAASYVSDVVKMVSVIHKTKENGAILAFFTSQAEVEWACDNFHNPEAMVLPLYGKLSHADQRRIFQNYAGKRKIIFSTNIAETSLTIPGVKFVVDSGMVKESRFEPSNGMNVLRVCRVSKSSAQQRAGRAGRNEAGKCYRLYSESDFELMISYQEPEILKVHMGISVLKILSLGIKNLNDFELIDTPGLKSIDVAIQNLVRLGAISCKAGVLELTVTGRRMVKLGIEPRLGKIILECQRHNLIKEGIVLAAVMANSSSIFCRVGSNEDKLKADCLRIPFCHPDGDLFTLLSVYKEWDREENNRNQWCWQNSVNAKSLRRCKETVKDIECCLRHELNIIVPSFWKWSPDEHNLSKLLKNAILSSLAENVAIYSGFDRLGYKILQTGEHVKPHPSSSLHIYAQKPSWVVFGDILSTTSEYLVCVTAITRDDLPRLQPPPSYDISKMEDQIMQTTIIDGIGTHLLKRLCGKGNQNLLLIVSRVRDLCKDDRADITINFDKGEIYLYTSSKDADISSSLINDAVNDEMKWLQNECAEKYLFRGSSRSNAFPSVALLGAGAEIKYLELEKKFLTVEITHPHTEKIDDKELLLLIDQTVSRVSGFCKHTCIGLNDTCSNIWGKITFLSPEASEEAVRKLNGIEFYGALLGVSPATSFDGDNKLFPFQAVRVKLSWPRRCSKGIAFIRCILEDIDLIFEDLYNNLLIGGVCVTCEISTKAGGDCIVVKGFDKDISEQEISKSVRKATNRNIIGLWLVRGNAVDNLSLHAYEEAILREITPFMFSRQKPSVNCRVEVFNPNPKDIMMKAVITFDGSYHFEAAKALDHLQGRVLSGFENWQMIECHHLFQSSVYCPRYIYLVIKNDLERVLEKLGSIKGGYYKKEILENGSHRIKLFANATRTMVYMRKPLDVLVKGNIVSHCSLTFTVRDMLLSRDGFLLIKSVERETGTCIIYDRHSKLLKVFGSQTNVNLSEKKLVQSLLTLHESKQLDIHLRGRHLPPNLMKEIVIRFGPDLNALKERVDGVDLVLNTRDHRICIKGTKEMKQKVDEIVSDVVKYLVNGECQQPLEKPSEETSCGICLCELEEPYKLEACKHRFCHSCLLEQCESAIRSHDGFPLCCAHEGCKTPIFIVDLRTLLPANKFEELFRASLSFFVTSNSGNYRFCPSPDCPMVYKVTTEPDILESVPFLCEACLVETCSKCHLEYHPFITCELYKEYKEEPDLSLIDWMKGKEEHVKKCPSCNFTIEKIDGCNHISCKCGKHICWVCLESFGLSEECYDHLRSIHENVT